MKFYDLTSLYPQKQQSTVFPTFSPSPPSGFSHTTPPNSAHTTPIHSIYATPTRSAHPTPISSVNISPKSSPHHDGYTGTSPEKTLPHRSQSSPVHMVKPTMGVDTRNMGSSPPNYEGEARHRSLSEKSYLKTTSSHLPVSPVHSSGSQGNSRRHTHSNGLVTMVPTFSSHPGRSLESGRVPPPLVVLNQQESASRVDRTML